MSAGEPSGWNRSGLQAHIERGYRCLAGRWIRSEGLLTREALAAESLRYLGSDGVARHCWVVRYDNVDSSAEDATATC